MADNNQCYMMPQVKIINNMNTLSQNAQRSLLLLLVALSVSTAAMSISYQKSAISSNVRPSFTTGYASGGGYINVIVNPTTAGVSYEVKLWRPN